MKTSINLQPPVTLDKIICTQTVMHIRCQPIGNIFLWDRINNSMILREDKVTFKQIRAIRGEK